MDEKEFKKKALCLDEYNNKKMDKIVIAFDVDGTLIDENDHINKPIFALIQLMHWTKNVTVVVWSGGGADYARTVVNRLGLSSYVDHIWDKLTPNQHVDIAFDDQQAFSLADKKVIVRLK